MGFIRVAKFIDLTGKKFNSLLVLSVDHKHPKNGVYWKCRCDCGNETVVLGSNLKGKHSTKSCGCLNHKVDDLTGMTFGRLTVVELDKNTRNKGIHWLCECSCGNTSSVLARSLKAEKTLSCGCLQKEKMSKQGLASTNSLVGKKFNRLTIVERVANTGQRGNSYKFIWKCQCECGAETFVTSYEVKNGKIKSCGCLSSEMLSKRNKENGYKLLKGIGAVENRSIRQYKRNAKLRNLEFELSDDEAIALFHGNCLYCGEIDKKQNNYTKEWHKLNGIDRIDSSKGYVSGNVVSCCSKCNRAKNNEKQEDFLSWVERVYNHYIKEKTNDGVYRGYDIQMDRISGMAV